MGIEFYGFFQARVEDQWREVGRYDHFDGVVQHWLAPWKDLHGDWHIEPISPWRGAPQDFTIPGENEKDYRNLLLLPTKTYCEISWLSADEILGALPVIEKWIEILDEAGFTKKSDKSYWDYGHAYWVTAPPRLVDVCKLRTVIVEGSEKFEVAFIVDRSAEVREFTNRLSALRQEFGQVRYVFYCEADW